MSFFRAWAIVASLLAAATWMHAEDGIAWEMQGHWRLNDTQDLLHRGDAVAPGALLTADSSTNASLLILLPDGQRLLFDCHDHRTCTQGFRVPALMTKPDDDAIELFKTVKHAMHHPGPDMPSPQLAPTTAEIEAIVPLQKDGTILLKTPLATLPPGQYRMTILSGSDGQSFERTLAWSGPHDEIRLPVPHTGIYRLQLFGSLGAERMRVVLLVASAEQFPVSQKAFMEARRDLQEWNETFPGWPMHEWLQLFLEELAQPQTGKNSSD